MSKFMDFLENIDNDIINETYIDDSVVDDIKYKQIAKKKTIKNSNTSATENKDSSVKLIESRIRTKLDDIGLNESTINDVINFVLKNVQSVNDLSIKSKTSKEQNLPIRENVKRQTVLGIAETILDGLSDTPIIGNLPINSRSTYTGATNFIGITDHASSLL